MAGVLGGHRYFSSSYDEARSRFRSACERHGAQQEALALDLQGPSGEALTIDLAWFGPRDAKRVVVTSSGTHGIEGYMGSAAQLAVLDRDLTLPDGVALLMIHAVNPYGFAFRRRVNEDNIDQNRNFLLAGEAYAGCPQGYHALNAMLNPTRAPKRRLSAPAFIARAVGRIARAGLGPLKEAVAGGQYTYPLGVFYGGSEPSRSMRALQEAVPRLLGHTEHVLWIDFHTGLGNSATFKHLVDHGPEDARLGWLVDTFGPEVEPWDAGDGVAYAIRGGLGTWAKATLPDAEVDVLAMEFGTVPVLKVITALHLENRAHHHGDPTSATTRAVKERIMATFNPLDDGWRDAVVDKGQHPVFTALAPV